MDNIVETKQKMQKVLVVLQTDLATVRTGRANPSLIENVAVSVYGGTQRLKIKEVATVSVSDPQSLTLTPFDHSIIDEIQKGILSANVGLTPSNDGNVLRISVPPLSQERRGELVRLVRQKAESARIMLRQVRHEAMSGVKKQFNDKEISQDELTRLEKQIQKTTDDVMAAIEAMREKKEEELMQI